MRLRNKIALVTGGNSGIGLATAQRFVAEGAQVIVTGRDERTLKAASEQPGITAIRSDVTDGAERQALFARVKNEFGRLDVLFANAGIVKGGPADSMTEADFALVLHTNLVSVFLCVQGALPLMGKGASIVLNGSMAASLGSPGIHAYAASKAGLRAMGRSLAGELSSRGIRVNVVVPGVIDTPIWQRMDRPPEEAARTAERLRGMIPLGRPGAASEVADAVLFLASDESAYVQGTELVVDGGILGAPGAAPAHQPH